jgi:hypothetical protein
MKLGGHVMIRVGLERRPVAGVLVDLSAGTATVEYRGRRIVRDVSRVYSIKGLSKALADRAKLDRRCP